MSELPPRYVGERPRTDEELRLDMRNLARWVKVFWLPSGAAPLDPAGPSSVWPIGRADSSEAVH